MLRSRIDLWRVGLLLLLSLSLSSPARGAEFVRGDVDASGDVDISDPVRNLMYLFVEGATSALPCLDAADANDDGDLNITDSIYVLSFFFLGGSPPPPPHDICGGDPSEDDLGCETFPSCSDGFGLLRGEAERDLDPDVTDEELAELVAGNNAFALDLYRAISDRPGNIFFSPYSISVALAMTYAGARSSTEVEMASTLHFTLPQEKLHPAFNRLDLELTSREESVEPDEAGDAFRLRVANSIWGQEGHGFLPGYLDVLSRSYDAGLRVLDLRGGPDASRRRINQWVFDRTEGRIEDLLPEGSILETTRLVLTNAIYFQASWKIPFEEERTEAGPFHRADGTEVTAAMMAQSGYFGVGTGEGWTAVELPYLGEQLSMVVIVPQGSSLAELEAGLTSAKLDAVIDSLGVSRIDLVLPRFTFEFDLPLSQTLQDLGMLTAFRWPGADFSGIDGAHDLFVQDVRHKAFVGVDEAGTEAAAATAVVVGVVSVPPEIRVDRPFIFLIRDIPTAAVLFLGRVVDPTR